MKSFKIGNIRIKNPVFLAPMVDVTDLAYRMLCRKWIGMAYTEMLYVDAILHDTENRKFPAPSTSIKEVAGNSKTKRLMKTCKEDKPVGLQITGNSLKELKKFSKLKLLKNYNLVDINCGCPSSRITGNLAGSYLLNNPNKIAEMIKILKKDNTVTAKIRLGFRKNNVLKVAKLIEKSGASALTIHARLAKDRYDAPADWKWIKKIKKEIGIPIIGNGDISSGEDVEKMLDICDGAMVARASIGNPLIFREIQRYLKTGKEKEIRKEDRINEFKKYLKFAKRYKLIDLGRIKFLGGNFLRGFEGAGSMRKGLMKLKTLDEFERFLEE